MSLKEFLATVGLAASLAGCGATNMELQCMGVLQRSTQGRIMCVPSCDWSRAERYALNYSDISQLSPGYETRGYLVEDGNQCQTQPCYDVIMEFVGASNGDRDRFIRVTVDTRFVNLVTDYQSPRFRLRAIFHANSQNRIDYAWIDDTGGNPVGYDGRYDRAEPVTVEFDEYVSNLLREQLRGQQR